MLRQTAPEARSQPSLSRHEGYDIITLQKLVEREYTIPEPQTAEEVIGHHGIYAPQRPRVGCV